MIPSPRRIWRVDRAMTPMQSFPPQCRKHPGGGTAKGRFVMRSQYTRGSVEARFWPKVDKTGDCWIWTAAQDGKGYGGFWDGEQRQKAHRVAYELMVGLIPTGLCLDHLCRNTLCVNPAHLEVVTQRVNILRGVGVSAQKARQTHCINGHELTPQNTYIREDRRHPSRSCRVCDRERHYASRHK